MKMRTLALIVWSITPSTWTCKAEAVKEQESSAELDLTTPLGQTSNEFQEFQESPPAMEAAETNEDVCCKYHLAEHRSSYMTVPRGACKEPEDRTKQVAEANEDMCKHYLSEHRCSHADEEPEDQPDAETTQLWIIGDTAVIEFSHATDERSGPANYSSRVFVTAYGGYAILARMNAGYVGGCNGVDVWVYATKARVYAGYVGGYNAVVPKPVQCTYPESATRYCNSTTAQPAIHWCRPRWTNEISESNQCDDMCMRTQGKVDIGIMNIPCDLCILEPDVCIINDCSMRPMHIGIHTQVAACDGIDSACRFPCLVSVQASMYVTGSCACPKVQLSIEAIADRLLIGSGDDAAMNYAQDKVSDGYVVADKLANTQAVRYGPASVSDGYVVADELADVQAVRDEPRGHYGLHTWADDEQDHPVCSKQMDAERRPEGTWNATQTEVESESAFTASIAYSHKSLLRNQSRVGCWYGPHSDPRTGNRLKSNPRQSVCLQENRWEWCWYGPHLTQRNGNRLKLGSDLSYKGLPAKQYQLKLALISRGMDPTSRLVCIVLISISVALVHATSQHASHALYIAVVCDALMAMMSRITFAICMQLSGHKSSMLSTSGLCSVLRKADVVTLVGIGACVRFYLTCDTQSIYFQQWRECAEAMVIGWGGSLVWTTLAPGWIFRVLVRLGWTAVGTAGRKTRRRKRRHMQGPKAWAEVPHGRGCVGRVREGQDPDILTAYICCTKVIGSQVSTIFIFRRKRFRTSTPCKSGPGGRTGGTDSGAYGHRADLPPGGKMRTVVAGVVGYSVHAALLGLVAPGGGGVTRARLLWTCVCFLGPTLAQAPAVGPPDREGRREGERVFKDGYYWQCLLGQAALGVGVASLFWVQEPTQPSPKDGTASDAASSPGRGEKATEARFQAQLSSDYDEDRDGRVAAAASSSHEQAGASWEDYRSQGYRGKSKEAVGWQDKSKGKYKSSSRRQDSQAWWSGKGSGSGWQQQDWAARDSAQDSSDYGGRGRWKGGYESGYSGAKSRGKSRDKSKTHLPCNPAKNAELAKQLTERIDKGNEGRLKIDLVISTDGQYKSSPNDKQDTPTGTPKSPKAVSFRGDTPERDSVYDRGKGDATAAAAAATPILHHFEGETADIRVKMAAAEAKTKAGSLTSDQKYNISKFNNDCLPILQGEHYMDADGSVHDPAVEEQDAVPYILEPRPIDHKDGSTEDRRVAPNIIEEAMWSEQYDETPFLACEQFPLCRAMTYIKKIEQRYGENYKDVFKLWCFGCSSLMTNRLKEHFERNGSSRALPIRAPAEVVKAAGRAYAAGREMVKAKAHSNRAELVLEEKGVDPETLSGMKQSLLDAVPEKLRKQMAISLQPQIDAAVKIADNASLADEIFNRCKDAYETAVAEEKAIRASTPKEKLGPYAGERWDITKLGIERGRLTKSLQKISTETAEHEKSLISLGKLFTADTELLRVCNECLTKLIPPAESGPVENDVTEKDYPRVPRDEAAYNLLAQEVYSRFEIDDSPEQADVRQQLVAYTTRKVATRARTTVTCHDDDMGVADNTPAQTQLPTKAPPPGVPKTGVPPKATAGTRGESWADMDASSSSNQLGPWARAPKQAASHGAAAGIVDHSQPAPSGRPEELQPAEQPSRNLAQPTTPVELLPTKPGEPCTAGHEAHLLCDKCPPQRIQEAVDEARRRKLNGLPFFEISHVKGCACKLCDILNVTPPASVTATPSNLPEIKSISTPPTPSSPKPRGRSASATRTLEETMAEEAEQDSKKQRTELEQDVHL